MATAAAAASKTPHILLLGGHGQISLLLTPLLLNKNYNLTTLIRSPSQANDIYSAAAKSKLSEKEWQNRLNVLVDSIEDVKSVGDAERVLGKVKRNDGEGDGGPDWVVFAAGAGGKGGAPRTFAIDQHAARHFLSASLTHPTVTKYLIISGLISRRSPAPWWNTADVDSWSSQVNGKLATWTAAKIGADEWATVKVAEAAKAGLVDRKGKEKTDFEFISFRPGTLSNEAPTGRVVMGRTPQVGTVTRADVAGSLAEVLGASGERMDGGIRTQWIDLLSGQQGEQEIEKEVERVLGNEKEDAVEGKWEEMVGRVRKLEEEDGK